MALLGAFKSKNLPKNGPNFVLAQLSKRKSVNKDPYTKI